MFAQSVREVFKLPAAAVVRFKECWLCVGLQEVDGGQERKLENGRSVTQAPFTE